MDTCSKKKMELKTLMPLFREKLDAGQNVKISPMGVSMLPMLRQGVDSVILSPVPERLHKYDLPLYQRENGKYILHRIIACGETYTCCGDNQYDPEPGVRREQMIAVVTAFTRGGKQISVRNPAYGLYCRLWCGSRGLRRFGSRVLRKLRSLLR